MMKRFLLTTMVLWFSFFSSIALSSVLDGTYIGVGSSSDIVVETNEEGQQRFTINVLSAGHVCIDVAGTLTENQGLVDDEEELGQCVLSFHQNSHILNVSIDTYEECRSYCGMRATLEGTFRIPPQICTLNAITTQRNEFKKLYDQKQYKDAENILNKVLNQCDFYLDFIQRDSIRNDLALALYHQNEPELCIEVLSSTVALDQNVYLPPMEQDAYADTESAIRFNWGLCGKQ